MKTIRKTVYNSKRMKAYMWLAILSITVWSNALIFYVGFEKWWMLLLSIAGFTSYAVFQTLILVHRYDYKWKYILTPKRFEKALREELKTYISPSEELIKKIRAACKDVYLRTGELHESAPRQNHTACPWNFFVEDCLAFNYGFSRDEEKTDFLLYELYQAAGAGGGLGAFFVHVLTYEPFTGEEVCALLKKCPRISDKLKEVVLSGKDDEDLSPFWEETYIACEDVALSRYSHLTGEFYKSLARERENVVLDAVYYSEDRKERAFVVKNEKANAYQVAVERFFVDPFTTYGFWESVGGGASSYYDSVETALKEVADKTRGFEKIDPNVFFV